MSLTPFRTGLSQPIFATNAGDGTGRVYVVEKTGRIKVLSSSGSYLGTLLNISDRTSRGGEQGLLGLAFHPDYAHHHRYYVDYTDRHGDTVIVEYRTSANGLTTTSGRRLIVIGQPYANHNGGMLAFGPDGYLYIGHGRRRQRRGPRQSGPEHRDAAREDPPHQRPAGPRRTRELPESHRPTRMSDRRASTRSKRAGPAQPVAVLHKTAPTGNLWIGDVGQNRWEEVDRSGQDLNQVPGPRRQLGLAPVLEGSKLLQPVHPDAAPLARRCRSSPTTTARG